MDIAVSRYDQDEPLEIDLRRVVFSLSDALDLVGVDDVLHGKRVALLAARMARWLGEDPERVAEIFDAGMLHDCGVSSTRVHRCLVDSLDWPGSDEHCIRGAKLLGDCRMLAHLAGYVRLHHWHWNRPLPVEEAPAIRRLANLIFIADRVDALASPHQASRAVLHYADEIRQRIRGHAGTLFSPELVAAFLDCSEPEAFWLGMAPVHVQHAGEDMAHPMMRRVQWADMRGLARLFARVVDAKSPFTVEHSEGVARLAAHLGRRCGMSEAACVRLELAGLLHDIGKLRIPDDILEKHGSLNEMEREVMISHSFETFQILRRTPGLDRIAALAAYHHERLDGSGYPFRLPGSEITREMRVLQVADVFQALAQRRPYREPLAVADILGMLDDMVDQRSLDADIVALVKSDPATCHAVAVGKAI